MAYYFSPFRKTYDEQKGSTNLVCQFCNPTVIEQQSIKHPSGAIVSNGHYVWVVNLYPRFEGHTMLIPKRHIEHLEDESTEEILARHHLLSYASRILTKLYENAGVEIFLQTGPGSASSVKHLHWHLVPARPDDPLRSFEKMGHFYTTEENQEKVLIFPIKVEKAREELQEALANVIKQDPYQPSP